jgi:APA family basic amino acid/polyamine antiporter
MLGRKKPVETLLSHADHQKLKPTLSWPHLVAMGVGAIIGTGIYALIGTASAQAGPAVMISFIIAGLVCVFAALCYAELATALPASGSAYTYSYVSMGERMAWFIGWSLVLEYTVCCAAVANGWSGYAADFLKSIGAGLPEYLLHGPIHPEQPGIMNLPAVFISLVVTGLLLIGVRESATVNLGLVLLKILALCLFIGLTIFAIRAANFEPFMPYGFGDPLGFLSVKPGEMLKGVMPAAAVIFFAFYGFDAVAAAAEETKNPGRDLTIGILGSMALCTVLYIVVAACAIGAVSFLKFSPEKAPLAFILRELGQGFAASLLSAAVILAMPTVIMVMMYGQTRVFFVMARDGLLPASLTKIAKNGVPSTVTLMIGVFVSLTAGVFELGDLASVANAGTLAAFMSVGAGVLIMRRTHPNLERKFRTPMASIVAPLAIIGCAYLFISLQPTTIIAFVVWNVIGFVLYFAYSASRSHLKAA